MPLKAKQAYNNRIELALPMVGLGPRFRSASHAERYTLFLSVIINSRVTLPLRNR